MPHPRNAFRAAAAFRCMRRIRLETRSFRLWITVDGNLPPKKIRTKLSMISRHGGQAHSEKGEVCPRGSHTRNAPGPPGGDKIRCRARG